MSERKTKQYDFAMQMAVSGLAHWEKNFDDEFQARAARIAVNMIKSKGLLNEFLDAYCKDYATAEAARIEARKLESEHLPKRPRGW